MATEGRPALAARPNSWALAGLIVATFTISSSFGLILPIAPQLVRAAEGQSAAVAMHAGGLTAVYMLAVALFAPMWGRLSDRHGRRVIIVVGLAGFALSMAAFGFVRTLPQLYLERSASGLFAAAIAPVAAAFVADAAPSGQWRASRMAWLNMASIAGFVLGPSLSVWTSAPGRPSIGLAGAAFAPFASAAAVALISASWIWLTMRHPHGAPARVAEPTARDGALTNVLLTLTFAAAAIVGVFEVSVSLRSGRLAGASQGEIAAMFAVCSLVMFVTQAVLFSPLVRAESTWRYLAPAFGLLSAGLLLASSVGGFAPEMTAVSVVAASAGAVSPTLAYWLSAHAGTRQGAQLGRQTAAASLGQAAGAAAGGWLLAWLGGGAPFLWSAGLAAASAVVALLIAPRLGALSTASTRPKPTRM